MKKIWGWLVVGILLIAAIGGYLWYRQQEPRTRLEVLRTGETIRGDLDITVAVSGNVVANQRVDLRFTVPGTVESIHVAVGDHVSEGQVLAQLDTTALQRTVDRSSITLEQAELRRKQLAEPVSEEDLRRARNTITQATAALNVSRLNYTRVMSSSLLNEDLTSAEERFRHLQTQFGMRQMEFEEGTTSDWTRDRAREAADNAYWAWIRLQQQAELERNRVQNDVTQAWNAYQEAKDNLAQLEKGPSESSLESSELDIKAAQLALTQAQEDLQAASLKSPFNGVVAAVNLLTGVAAPTTAAAITLIDDSVFFVDVTVDETDIGKIQIGQQTEITLDAYADMTLDGEVVTIAPLATNVAGVIAYPVRVRISPNEAVAIRDGMTASILIRTRQLQDVVLIPNWAIRTDPTSRELFTYCYCLGSEQEPQRVVITLGERNESFTQVLEGLEAGATVALVTEERVNLLELTGPPSGMR
ncbi:MAG: Macrolide export protein MacA [Chloroflexi bacterium ADurb.Bin360]|nr:MAG: Macrolide export protein MacA [Chloroflexi bacterium ADurb.Bin360]